MLWKAVRGEMRLPGEAGRWETSGALLNTWEGKMVMKGATHFIALNREKGGDAEE